MCKHWRRHRSSTTTYLDRYKSLIQILVYPTKSEHKALKVRARKCVDCQGTGTLIICCLECAYAGCSAKGHFLNHSNTKKHHFGFDNCFGQLYCGQCEDVIYDKDFETARRNIENTLKKHMGFTLKFKWNPGRNEIEQLKSGRKRVLRVQSNSTFGLRGLLNLGNTCFMNCILQALTHTPLLRDYFLSDQHRCQTKTAQRCLMCEMGRVFQEFYSGVKSPYIPYKLLHLVWTHARHLAGYEQQDAHEFLIAALDVLHKHSRSYSSSTKSGCSERQCQCIIDRIFTGRLQSDVTCQSCHGVSTTVDPYWDISLDLAANDSLHKSDFDPSSLQDCLMRFTRPENLGSGAKIKCSKCQVNQESTKQLTLRTLPIVACFHLKRFESSTHLHKKISRFVSFPQFLDLTPFTSRHRDISVVDKDSPPSTQDLLQSLENKYALFAVVNHSGTLEAGHYTCFIRQRGNDWFQCEDHVITPASLDHVLQSEGYLLFYHKQFIQYD